jgi:hypothetical protein
MLVRSMVALLLVFGCRLWVFGCQFSVLGSRLWVGGLLLTELLPACFKKRSSKGFIILTAATFPIVDANCSELRPFTHTS